MLFTTLLLQTGIDGSVKKMPACFLNRVLQQDFTIKKNEKENISTRRFFKF